MKKWGKENSKNNILNRLYYTLHTVLLTPASYLPGGTLKQRDIIYVIFVGLVSIVPLSPSNV